MKLKKISLTFILFTLCFIIFNIYLSFNIVKANSSKNKIIRLHVVANSNEVSDQLTKLKVSSEVENYINTLNLENKYSDEILNILNNNIENIYSIVNKKLKEENISYGFKIDIGKIYYTDSKDTPILHMNSGLYNSIKITLGDGKGKNFWNFIAPNKENIEKLTEYENILPGIKKLYNSYKISNENSKNNDFNIKYESKILELFNNYIRKTTHMI